MNDVTTTLTAARATVEAGWSKYGLTDGRGGHCLKAAIGLASGVYQEIAGQVVMPRMDYATATTAELRARSRAFGIDSEVMEVVRQVLPVGFDSIPVFNDDPRTTKADVIAVLDDALRFVAAHVYKVAAYA